MSVNAATLEPLDNAARGRVLEWAGAVFGDRGGDRTDENPANQPPLGLNQRHSGAPSAPSPFGLAISAIVG